MRTSRDVIVYPVHRRTRYIQESLIALAAARGMQDKELWVFQSNHEEYNFDLEPVKQLVESLQPLFAHSKFTRQERHNHLTMKPWMHPSQHSTYLALLAAYSAGAPKVYYIESDVLVAPDFFEWHDMVQADGDYMVTSAWRQPEGILHEFDIEFYYIPSPIDDEVVHGACIKRTSLEHIITHEDWWNGPRMRAEDWQCARPYVPRCYHIGSSSELDDQNTPQREPAGVLDCPPNPLPDYRASKVVLK